MRQEIERRFLVRDEGWRAQARGAQALQQGYLAHTALCSVRVRAAAGEAWLTIKGRRSGAARSEFEYPIPPADAAALLAAFTGEARIEKQRHPVPVGRHLFEVDEFGGANRGLVIAEIELAAADEEFPRPAWLGDEVTDDERFYNASLAAVPFGSWPEQLRRAARCGRRAAEAGP
jgi:adenylate cyclase